MAKNKDDSTKFKLSRLIFPLIVLIIVITILFKFSELQDIAALFKQARWYFLAFALAAQFLGLVSLSQTYNAVFHLLKLPAFNFKKILKLTTAVMFLNFTIPSGGTAGNVWLFKKFRDSGVNEGKALLSIFIEVFCYYVAMGIGVLFFIIYLSWHLGQIGNTYLYIIGASLAIVIAVGIFITSFFKDEKKAKKKLAWLASKIDDVDDGRTHEERMEELLKDFYKTFRKIKERKRELILPIAFQFGKFMGDALTIFFIFLAFDKVVSVFLCLAAFIAGRFMGSVLLVPGGIGAFEGAMTLVINSFYPIELALSVMLIYRFFSYWIYIPVGLYLTRKFNKTKIKSSA